MEDSSPLSALRALGSKIARLRLELSALKDLVETNDDDSSGDDEDTK